MSEQPLSPGRKPVILELQPGTYWWCTCGRSALQPFCDDSHKGTCFEPREITVTEPTKCALCTCKLTRNPPFCDGSHKMPPPLE